MLKFLLSTITIPNFVISSLKHLIHKNPGASNETKIPIRQKQTTKPIL